MIDGVPPDIKGKTNLLLEMTISKEEFCKMFITLTGACDNCLIGTCDGCETNGKITFLLRQRALTKIKENKARGIRYAKM